MEREPYCKDGIIKTRKFPLRTIRKLGSSKEVDRDSKKSHEETVWQEKKELTKIKDWWQCMAWGQKYPFKLILKEAGLSYASPPVWK